MAICASGEKSLQEATCIRRRRVYQVAKTGRFDFYCFILLRLFQFFLSK